MTKIDPEKNSLCEEDTVRFYHLIADCPRLRQARPDCKLFDFDTDSRIPGCLMEFARTPAVEALWTGIDRKEPRLMPGLHGVRGSRVHPGTNLPQSTCMEVYDCSTLDMKKAKPSIS